MGFKYYVDTARALLTKYPRLLMFALVSFDSEDEILRSKYSNEPRTPARLKSLNGLRLVIQNALEGNLPAEQEFENEIPVDWSISGYPLSGELCHQLGNLKTKLDIGVDREFPDWQKVSDEQFIIYAKEYCRDHPPIS